MIPISTENKKKIDLSFLIQHKQFTMIIDFINKEFKTDKVKVALAAQAKDELSNGNILKCSEHLEKIIYGKNVTPEDNERFTKKLDEVREFSERTYMELKSGKIPNYLLQLPKVNSL